jgi:acylphosphatase
MEASARILVKGRVQGVGYRYYILRQAQELGLTGYVRNLPNGDVEIVAEGDRQVVEQLIRYAERGPVFAHVNEVQVQWSTGSGQYKRFDVRY